MMSEELERVLVRLTEPDNAVIQQVDTYMKLSYCPKIGVMLYLIDLILIILVNGYFQCYMGFRDCYTWSF